jgi:hypothetical protein
MVNLAGLALAAVALRVWRLGTIPGVNGDEAWTAVQALAWLNGQDVAWRTPNGNPLNPFYMLPTLLLHALAAPSFVLLRLTALASGLLSLVVNFLLCRRAFDLRTAILSTWILALMPIDIAYSRFAWDASQSLLATMLVMYPPLMRREGRPLGVLSGWATVALACAIVVHPTNVFAAPLLLMPALVLHRKQLGIAWKKTKIPAGGANLAALVLLAVAGTYVAWRFADRVVDHLHGPSSIGDFLRLYLQLFSGTTVYSFISGATLSGTLSRWSWLAPAGDTFCLVLAVAALAGWLNRRKLSLAARDASLAAGWATMLAGFFLVAGPEALAPHAERYGICLIAPGALMAARGLAWWLERSSARRASAIVFSLAAWWWPVSFALGYFVYIEQTGGTSHATFRTADIEPKLQAWRRIEQEPRGGRAAWVVCQEFWNYWPLAYLAAGRDDVRVVGLEQWLQEGPGAPDDATWFVEYAGSTAEARVLAMRRRATTSGSLHIVYDFGGRPVLSVVGPAKNFSQNY